ncbi:MAG: metallophosphoesterase [Bacteroidota bacterium]
MPRRRSRATPTPPPRKTRPLQHLHKRPMRSAGQALAQSYIDPPPRKAKDFLTKATFTWIINYLKVIFTPRVPFPEYRAPLADRPGIFPLARRCKVALVGDWGSGTKSAYKVMDDIRKSQKPDVTIHLGDIYYSGQVNEVEEYFLGKDDWYRAKQSFALNGNHEMYSGGEGYFDHVLPALNQETSYFCLENEHWRIIGLDTGYYSKVFPLLELFLGTKLPDAIMKWLKRVVFADGDDRRPVLLLTHHQWFSAFDTQYPTIGRQLEPYLGKAALWIWGHEHRFAGYARHALSGGTAVRARCIGHGGMPVELEKPKRESALVFYDSRVAATVEGDPIGYCGNGLLEFDGQRLVIRYIDEMGTELLVEEWKSGGRAGGATGKIRKAAKEMTWVREAAELVR